ncbi:D-alanyl-D-alanine carboxypeptidase/D-alanyl-D-alanine-endopeptidase (penicillin-binding protein 4) [Stackebrandtia endophytica]|uniref:D-alanyl-D-alanine carboxypeptidase/D-alanyl-D-alanine-endopeptidase (Penicillin-binding protein 4) n=1 Tax=Stackebrandtia endophytica TaxID=1496996 RepID=A0A543B176_9ACTN|nr:D-alanyl-D-alanine carboxypeptidase/D-alanyl-D-alanine-endopeptidase [Stackebrandtia endophytica]TQL78583.1 D-alanyl-D-alanine carboxypeptidase/D-alanyl-D-alanine-endopeptidase (penicillin-binding protein 4) [Stackebrandtia endophytica]
MWNRPLSHAVAVAALIAGSLTVATVVSAEESGDENLRAALDQILSDDAYSGAQLGLVVADAESGEVLYDRGGSQRLVPASNTKLLTSAAAIGLLGEDYTFTTDVATDGTQRGRVLHGDLYLRGTGDPTMLAADYDALAAEIAASGVKHIRGDLVADDTAFDSVRLGPEWGWDDLSYYYAAEISALTVAPDTDYDAGTVVVTVEAGAEGEAPTISVDPPTDWVEFDNRATTVAEGGSSSIGIERRYGSNLIEITGQLPEGGSSSEWVTVSNPTGYAADVFAAALKDHGVRVSGDIRLGQSTPDGAATLASHESMDLADLLVPFMKLSNNGHAETLTKAIGREISGEGTWSAGLSAIEDFVGQWGMNVDTQRQSDGSGLSRWNLIPTREFANLLVAVRSAEWYDTWYASMPIACESDRFEGGTLRSRMCDTPAESNVHAKTGSLTSVSGLSGYVTDADGRELVFSFISNDYLVSSVKGIEDAVAITLASYSQDGEASVSSVTTTRADDGPTDRECSWVKPSVC